MSDQGDGTYANPLLYADYPDPDVIWVGGDFDLVSHKGLCQFSLDGAKWQPLGGAFLLAYDWRTVTFQGQQYAVFSFSATPSEGHVDVDWFRLSGLAKPALATKMAPPNEH